MKTVAWWYIFVIFCRASTSRPRSKRKWMRSSATEKINGQLALAHAPRISARNCYSATKMKTAVGHIGASEMDFVCKVSVCTQYSLAISVHTYVCVVCVRRPSSSRFLFFFFYGPAMKPRRRIPPLPLYYVYAHTHTHTRCTYYAYECMRLLQPTHMPLHIATYTLCVRACVCTS